MTELILEWDGSDDDFDWDCLIDELTGLMNQVNKRFKNQGYWRAEVQNFGWRSQNGEKTFKAYNGKEFLEKILPKTDCRFKIFRDKSEIRIQNFHHDSPYGKEWYYIRPLTTKEVEEFHNF